MIIYYKTDSSPNDLDFSTKEETCKLLNWNYKKIDIEIDPCIQGIKKQGNKIVVFPKPPPVFEVKKSLRIQKYMQGIPVPVRDYDFTLLEGVKLAETDYDKGRKSKNTYTGVDDEIVVEIAYSDVLENQKLKRIDMTFNWFDIDGNVGETKTKTKDTFNVQEANTVLRTRRQRVVDYLLANAEEKGLGAVLSILFKHFKEQISDFITAGSSEFKDAINAELTNANSPSVNLGGGVSLTIKQILTRKLPATTLHPNGQTVAQGIIDEL